MPFIDHPKGRAYYRHWAAAEPRAAVIFLHGFGEHTGVYHRYGFALNAVGIDLWAVDQFGHGLSPGNRGDFGSIEDSSALGDALTDLAEREQASRIDLHELYLSEAAFAVCILCNAA